MMVAMREAFAQDAALSMAPDADERAPGAAITVALCGHLEHPPPCPLAPHHTAAKRVGGTVHLRVLFAAERQAETEVRSRIELALGTGRLTGPDGVTTQWQLISTHPGSVSTSEQAHAARLIGS